jgi:hypothetical protein
VQGGDNDGRVPLAHAPLHHAHHVQRLQLGDLVHRASPQQGLGLTQGGVVLEEVRNVAVGVIKLPSRHRGVVHVCIQVVVGLGFVFTVAAGIAVAGVLAGTQGAAAATATTSGGPLTAAATARGGNAGGPTAERHPPARHPTAALHTGPLRHNIMAVG